MRIMKTKMIDCALGWSDNDLQEAANLLQQGQLVAFPTETVYGLGGSALNSQAIQAIYRAKGRPSDNPLIVHVSSVEMVARVARSVPEIAGELMRRFWPGPLTLVLPKAAQIPSEITGGLDTVAIRMPDHPVALALLEASGLPIAAPSANLSGRPSPTTAEHVFRDLEGSIPLILNGGPCREGVESTVLDLSREPAVILRPGAVTYEMLLPFIPNLLEATGTVISQTEAPMAPGMKYAHYAPKAPITLYSGSEEAVCRKMCQDAHTARANGEKIGVIITQYPCKLEADLLFDFYHPDTNIMLHQTAQQLFQSFRSCDDDGVHRILLQGVSEKDLGRAVMNRMVKAAKEWIRLDRLDS